MELFQQPTFLGDLDGSATAEIDVKPASVGKGPMTDTFINQSHLQNFIP